MKKSNKTCTATDIINRWCSMCLSRRPGTFVFPNTYIGAFEADIVEITKAGYAHEFEVKTSRSDFRIDSAKEAKYRWHDNEKKYDKLIAGNHVNSFSFVVPDGMVTVDDVPEWAGLIYVTIKDGKPYWFRIVKPAKSLSKEKHGDRIKDKCYMSTYFRFHKLRIKPNG